MASKPEAEPQAEKTSEKIEEKKSDENQEETPKTEGEAENKDVIQEEPKASDTAKPSEDDETEVKVVAEKSSWSSWSSWVTNDVMKTVTQATSVVAASAKQKSNEVMGMVAKDLEEVQNAATSMVGSTTSTLNAASSMAANTASSLSSTLKDFDDKTDELADKALDGLTKSVSSFWKTASNVAASMFVEEDEEGEAIVMKDGNPVVLDRLQAQLHALATDPNTFAKDPDEKDKDLWDEYKVDLEKRQGEISDLMVSNASIRQQYTALVPDKIQHQLFWRRYFFKVHLIELQEAKRQALKKRLAQEEEKTKDKKTASALDDDDVGGWEDVDDITDGAIPEKLQDKLLSDYEKELKEKKTLLSEEVDAVKSSRSSDRISQEKESTGSDDWENLSSGEKSPKKTGGKDEEDWVKT